MLLDVEVQTTHHHPTQFDIGHKLESEFAAIHLPSEISVSHFCILVIVQVVQQTIKKIEKLPSTRSNVITAGLHVRSIGWMLGNRIILGPIMTTIQEAGGSDVMC